MIWHGVTNESNVLKKDQWFWNQVFLLFACLTSFKSYGAKVAHLSVHFILTSTKSWIICIQYYIINTSFFLGTFTYWNNYLFILQFLKMCGLIWHNVLRTTTLLRTTQWPCLHYNMCKQTYIEINHVHLSISCFSYLCPPTLPFSWIPRRPSVKEPEFISLHSSTAIVA